MAQSLNLISDFPSVPHSPLHVLGLFIVHVVLRHLNLSDPVLQLLILGLELPPLQLHRRDYLQSIVDQFNPEGSRGLSTHTAHILSLCALSRLIQLSLQPCDAFLCCNFVKGRAVTQLTLQLVNLSGTLLLDARNLLFLSLSPDAVKVT